MSVAKRPVTRQAPPPGPADPTSPLLDPLPGIFDFGTVNLLAGASGVGKTCLTAWLLTRLRDSLPIFDRQPNPVPHIAYVCADRGWSSTKVWLERVGFGDIAHYSLVDDLDFNPDRLYNKRELVTILGESLSRLGPFPRGSFVVIDPLALFMGGNLNDYHVCASALIKIRRMALRLGITILGLSHASKQKSDSKDQYKRLQDRILGSAAQHGYGDTQLYLASPEETGEKFYTFLWHPHLSPAQHFPLERDSDTGLFVPYGTAAGNTPSPDLRAPIPAESAEGKVLSQIPEAPETVGFAELVQASVGDASRASVHRYLLTLLEAGAIVKAGHGRYQKPRPS